MSRKDEILEALIDIFKTEGMSSDFTMSQLAQKVNIGKSTLYEYFKTKNEIITEAIFKVLNTSIEGIFSRQIKEDATFEETYKGELQYLFELGTSSRFLVSIITPQVTKDLPDECRLDIRTRLQMVGSHYQKRFADIFQLGVEEGVISGENILVNGTMISSLVIGSLIRMTNAHVDDINQIPIQDYVNAVYVASLKIAN